MARTRIVLGIATIAALAIVVVAVVVLFGGGAPDVRVEPSAAPATNPASTDRASPAASAHREMELDVPATPTSNDAGAAREEEVENVVGREGPTILVIERETNHPRPDAAVWLLLRDDASDDEWKALRHYDADAEKLLAERGRAVELDRLATARLDWKASEALIVASAGERRVRRVIRLDASGRIFLRLVRREALTILTEDPGGRRQPKVPVSLQSLVMAPIAPRPERASRFATPATLELVRETDKNGELRVPFGSELLDESLDADGLSTTSVLVAALAFPCRDPCATLLDARRGCEKPVELVTPPRSTLRLRAVSATGESIGVPVEVRAAVADAPASRIPVAREWLATIAAGGVTELTVEANATVELAASAIDDSYESARISLTAPPPAQSSDVTLVLNLRAWADREKKWCSVLVRAPDGLPLASTDLQWQVDGAPEPVDGLLTNSTDGSGVLRIESKRLANANGRSTLRLFEGVDRPPSSGARRDGSLLLPKLTSSDSIDLGTIQLRDVPVLVAGRVVNVEGHGIADVNIGVEEQSLPPRTWRIQTSGAGRFVLRARSKSSRLALSPERDGWYRPDEYDDLGRRVPIVVAAGESELTITLHRKGWARGRLQVDPGISLVGLFLSALPRPAPDVRCRIDDDGRFYVEGAPGIRTLTVRSRLGGVDPIAQVESVRLDEGEETVDPRLDPIDLGGSLRQVELTVRGTDGTPVSNAALFLARKSMYFAESDDRVIAVPRSIDPFGRAIVTTPVFDSFVVVGSRDHMFTSIDFERAIAEVTLAPAAIVRVKAAGSIGPALSTGQIFPTLELTRADGGAIFAQIGRDFEPLLLQGSDATTFELSVVISGDYSLVWKRHSSQGDWKLLTPWKSTHVDARGARVEVVQEFTDQEVETIRRAVGR